MKACRLRKKVGVVGLRRRTRLVLLVAACWFAAGMTLARASGLLVGATGVSENSTNGSTVAEPLSPSGAMLLNPAGLAGFEKQTTAASFGLGFGQEQIRAQGNPAYRPEKRMVVMIPDFAMAAPLSERTTLGLGVSGSVGSTFNFNADPGAGVPADFFSELSIVNAPIGLSYEVSDKLWLGAEIIPLFGYFRTHFPTPVVPVRFSMTGPGIQSMAGLTWRPTDAWSVGLGLRSPGIVWLRGSMGDGAGSRQDVDLDVKVPAQITLGVSRRVGERLTLSVAGRWTDSSSLRRSRIEFERTPQINTPFFPDTTDEWRGSVGAQYRLSDSIEWRIGYGYATRIVGNRGLSPLLFDSVDNRLGSGLAWTRGAWTVEAMLGYWMLRSRYVSAQNALIIPGRYRFGGGGVAMIGLVHRI